MILKSKTIIDLLHIHFTGLNKHEVLHIYLSFGCCSCKACKYNETFMSIYSYLNKRRVNYFMQIMAGISSKEYGLSV